MKTRSVRILALTWMVTQLLHSLRVVAGQDPQIAEAPDREQKIQAQIDASVERYRLLATADARRPLDAQVAIRWRNPTRDGQANAILVLWVHDGRPAAAASVFAQSQLCHEFVSLSRAAGPVAYEGDAVVWSPSVAGIEFQDVPDAPTPADSPAVRMRQMKSLTERFAATLTGWKASESPREELRLLPQRLYRYDMKAAGPTHADLLDGAMFAFVQGTDPETLLLLEAVVAGDGPDARPRWQYAFSRATSGGLEARLDSKLVWKVEQMTDDKTPTNPQVVLRKVIAK